jgi:predicted MFS family arabinose efflux permease
MPEIQHEDVLTADQGLPNQQPIAQRLAYRAATGVVRRSAWNALNHRDFRLYFAGSLISNVGTWMQNTAQVLLVYKLTHSVFAVGVVTCAQFSGFLLLGPWAAVVARRMGGRRMLIAAQMASAGVAGYLAIQQAMGSLGERTLVVCAAGLGLIFTFALPIQTEFVPRLVPKAPASTAAAMAMNSVSYNIGRAVAPVICVLVVVTNGFAWAFAANAISFLVYLAFLMAIRPRPTSQTPRRVRARDGVLVAFRQPRVLLLLAMVAAVTFADDPILIQGPALARYIPDGSSNLPGFFLTALGLGTVLGSLRPMKDPRKWDASRTSKRAAKWLLVLFVAIVIFALGFEAWISLVAAFVAGVAALHTGALTQTQLTRHRPEHTGSVMALWAIAWAGTKPIASLADGWLSSHVCLGLAAALVAAPALVLGLLELFLRNTRRERLKEFGKNNMANWLSPPSPMGVEAQDSTPVAT